MVISCLTQPLRLCNSFCTHDNLVCLDFIFASFWSPLAHVPLARVCCAVRAAWGLHHKNFICAYQTGNHMHHEQVTKQLSDLIRS